MRKLLLILVLLPFSLPAQNLEKQLFNVESFAMFESNNLNNDFFLNFYTGQFLDSSLKHNALSQLKDNNSMGFFAINDIRYGYISSEKKLGPYFNLSYQRMLGVEFSDNLFELIFIGNERFSGQNIDLKPVQIRSLEFGNIQAGAMYLLNDQITVYAYAGPTFGMTYQELNTKNLNMYTSDITDSIALSYNLIYTRNPAYPYLNGFGFSAGFGAEGFTSDVHWSFQADNLGMLWYNKKSVSTLKDSIIEFNGFEIDELSNISTSIEEEMNRIENAFVLNGDTAKIQHALPFKAEINLHKEFSKFNLHFRAMYINITGFAPYLELRPSKKICKSLSLSVPIKFGSFGSFNTGIGIEGILHKNLYFKIYSPALLSAIGIMNKISYGLYATVYLKLSNNESSF